MARRNFEELPVWQAAIRMVDGVYDLTESGKLRGHYDLRSQFERSALSVSLNIAEGWDRGTHDELLTFLYYARGSCAEARSIIRFLMVRDLPGLRDDLERLLELALNTSRQLGGWLESLKNSDSRGPRYRNDATRRAEEEARRRAAFMDRLRDIQDQARRDREKSEPPPPDPASP
jgi:four helix bundle protein